MAKEVLLYHIETDELAIMMYFPEKLGAVVFLNPAFFVDSVVASTTTTLDKWKENGWEVIGEY